MDPHKEHPNLAFPTIDDSFNNVLNNHVNDDDDRVLECFATLFVNRLHSNIRRPPINA